MIAALYVKRGGPYWGRPDIDAWDKERDARLYAGPHPVIAHPPCSRWCQLAGLVEARWGHKKGDDGGCFEAALASVRSWGGVLEHPAYSKAWPEFGLPVPSRFGGWQFDIFGGAACYVEQGAYGHPARKATWLYAHGFKELPALRWGCAPDGDGAALVSWCANKVDEGEARPRVGRDVAAATPPAFLAALLEVAKKAEVTL